MNQFLNSIMRPLLELYNRASYLVESMNLSYHMRSSTHTSFTLGLFQSQRMERRST